MAYSSYSPNSFGAMLTLWVRRLLIANVAVFVLRWLLGVAFGFSALEFLAFRPVELLTEPWTPLTYMFVHGDFFHLLFNMLGLFFFGPVLEDRWGSREFIKFYLLCGLGGALFSVLFPQQSIIGASAAVYGVMVAFALYWPDTPIYVWGVFPVKAKWLVAFLVGMSLFFSAAGSRSGTAHLAHLGGAVMAFGYLKSPWAPSAFGEVYASNRGRSRSRTRRGWRDLLPRRKPKAVPTAPTPARPAATPQVRRDLDDVDRILDKISSQGIGSLTPEERRRLEEASRRLGTN